MRGGLNEANGAVEQHDVGDQSGRFSLEFSLEVVVEFVQQSFHLFGVFQEAGYSMFEGGKRTVDWLLALSRKDGSSLPLLSSPAYQT